MIIIGHRGARGLAPENTVASLEKAVSHCASAVEFDVRITGDSKPILHHDAFLTDASGRRLRIADHTLEQLRTHKSDLATLDEALEQLKHDAISYIEVKPGEPVGPIVHVIKRQLRSGVAPERMLLASKSQRTLKQLHAALPELGIIVVEPWSGVRGSWRARQLGTKKLSMNKIWLWSGFIRSMHRHGYELYAYTLNDPVKAKKWQKYGLAGVVTDYPDRFEM